MIPKHIVLKKAYYYFCFLIVFLFSGSLYSQIIYTDIVDATPSATYPLDLNNDNVVDFLIQFDATDKVMCKPQDNNAYLGDFYGGLELPLALAGTNTICATSTTWYGVTQPGTMASGTSIGHWVAVTNRFLALKLSVGTNTFYGWARFDFNTTSSSFTIKDYAYHSSPNSCIRPGQTVLGLNEISKQTVFSILPNPFNDETQLKISEALTHASLTIYNAQGQVVRRLENISGQTILIPRDQLASGLYFIQLTEDNTIIAVEKLIIVD